MDRSLSDALAGHSSLSARSGMPASDRAQTAVPAAQDSPRHRQRAADQSRDDASSRQHSDRVLRPSGVVDVIGDDECHRPGRAPRVRMGDPGTCGSLCRAVAEIPAIAHDNPVGIRRGGRIEVGGLSDLDVCGRSEQSEGSAIRNRHHVAGEVRAGAVVDDRSVTARMPPWRRCAWRWAAQRPTCVRRRSPSGSL